MAEAANVTSGASVGQNKSERYIQQQLDRTGRQVKIVDLASAMMVLLAAMLLFILTVAIVDHWLFGLGVWGRSLALLTLLGGGAYYFIAVVVPLIWKPINPAFSARAIEESEPTLKNSLINFLMFRQDRAGLRNSVYHSLQQRAATDLSQVSVETAVDRSRLIKVGYVLVGALTICAVYTILSPKSPFQTMARVMAPWADISRPSRVRIEEVKPGDQKVFYGESVKISAMCYDIDEQESVTLFYSSLNGQISQKTTIMNPTEGGLLYEAMLPPDSGSGLEQDLVYWIEAGDAKTPVYRLTVLPAPTILVQRVEYEFPEYTSRPKRIAERQGDIKGLEGTRVTIHAHSNLPIRTAWIEFNPSESTPDNKIEKITMQSSEKEASASFVLSLSDDRKSAKYSNYHIRFYTKDDQKNQQPILHRLEVTRDLPPEVEILRPEKERVEVPADGTQRIEIRAIDPDFGLSQIKLRAIVGNQDLLDHDLLMEPLGQSGQTLVNYDFQPNKLNLSAGDEVTFWATAADNRRAPSKKGEPVKWNPNQAKTRSYHLIIVPAKRQPNVAPKEEPKPDPTKPETPPNKPDDPKEDGNQENQNPTNKKEKGGMGEDMPSDNGEPGSEDTQGQGNETGEQTGEEGNPQQKGSPQPGQGAQGDQTKPGENSDQVGDSSQTGTGQGNPSGSPSGEGENSETGDNASGSGQPTGKPGDPNSGNPKDARPKEGSQGDGPSEPLHDGEVFEKALEHLREQEEKNQSGQAGSNQTGESPDGNSTQDSQNSDATGGSPKDQTGSPSSGKPEGEPKDGTGGDSNNQGRQPGDAKEPKSGGAGQKPQDAPKGQPNSGAEGQEGQPQGNEKKKPSGSPKSGSPQGGSSGQKKEQQGGSEQEAGNESGSEESPEQKPSGGSSGKQSSSGSKEGQKKEGSSSTQSQSSGSEKKKDDGKQQKSSGGSDSSPSENQKQSSTQSASDGDKSGDGKGGGGQNSKQPGSDKAGSTSPSDEGAGADQESGSGEQSQRPGDKKPSDSPTGSPSKQKGPGSSSKPSKDGSSSGHSDDKNKPEGGQQENATGDPGGAASKQNGRGAPQGGGKPGLSNGSGFEGVNEVPDGEKANLEYARKATDLALEHLKDQQQSADPNLLKKLGMTQEELNAFVKRWKSMKQGAVEDLGQGKSQLDESLRSLGLRSSKTKTRSVGARNDAVQNLRDSGTRSQPPKGFLEQFKAFKKGSSRKP